MSASAGFQKHLFEALTQSADIAGFVADRIYDERPDKPVFPYITLGPSDYAPDNMDGVEARIENFQIDVWSRKPGKVEARLICDQIKTVLHETEADIEGGALILMNVTGVNVSNDPDQLTKHGIVRLEAHIEEDPAG